MPSLHTEVYVFLQTGTAFPLKTVPFPVESRDQMGKDFFFAMDL